MAPYALEVPRRPSSVSTSSSAPSLFELPARPVSRQCARPVSRAPPPPPPLPSQPPHRSPVPPAPPRRRQKSVTFADLPGAPRSPAGALPPAANVSSEIDLDALPVVTDVSDWRGTHSMSRTLSRTRRRAENSRERRRKLTGSACLVKASRPDDSKPKDGKASIRRRTPAAGEAECVICRRVLLESPASASGEPLGLEGVTTSDDADAALQVFVRKAFGHLWVCTACMKDTDLCLRATRRTSMFSEAATRMQHSPAGTPKELSQPCSEASKAQEVQPAEHAQRGPPVRCSSLPSRHERGSEKKKGGFLAQLGSLALLPAWPRLRSLSREKKVAAPKADAAALKNEVASLTKESEDAALRSSVAERKKEKKSSVPQHWRRPTPLWLEEALLPSSPSGSSTSSSRLLQ
eukprot:TRINITY_DN75863_c0_g1_i1.p1 TRINITY_DN75863_c0_g1~~TRINITY_DN75863_c0_g1_i1.p1  ORF type:complete len:430 (+),score=81.18 TRINITY_DN75863_c0_g1_i1:73-1290(+)